MMRKVQPKQTLKQSGPAARQSDAHNTVSAETDSLQLKTFSSHSAANLVASINASSPLATQRKLINNMQESPLAASQLEKAESLIPTKSIGISTTQYKSPDSVPVSSGQESIIQREADEDEREEGDDHVVEDEEKESTTSLEAEREEDVNGMVANEVKESVSPAETVSAGKDSDDEEHSEWEKQVGLRLLGLTGPPTSGDSGAAKPEGKNEIEPEHEEIRTDEPKKDTVTPPAGTPLSFMKVPAKYPKFKTVDNSYEKFQQEQQLNSERAATKESGKDEGSTEEESSAISEYTGGIVDLVKSGFKSCMKLRETYQDYQLVKEDSEEDASKLEGTKIAFELALSGTSGILSGINQYQKSFGAAQSLAIQAAIPAISIVMSTISLIGRIVTLVQQGNLDFGKTAEESQTDSILSSVIGDDKKKAEVKQILQSDKFRALIVATAEYRQQERDNPEIFSEYRKSQDDAELQERLKKRYPDNFARIEEISKNNKVHPDEIGPETKKLKGLGVSEEMLEAIIGDQTLINHLEEVKDKRSTNAKIGIFTDLVNIGADIATLTGTGAVVGAAMKAGTAAIGLARSGGNAIKFAARAKGAEDFSGGAEGGLFGSSLYDSTDILKNDEAKKERYFHSSRRLVENIADHDKKIVDAGKTLTKDQVNSINTSYGWVESKILGTGASVTMIKAMANTDRKTGDDVVTYFMEKMKER